MKFTNAALKVGLLAALSCSLLGLTGCGGSDDAKQSSAAEVEAFNGKPGSPEAQAAAERAKAADAQQAANAQQAAQAAPPPAAK